MQTVLKSRYFAFVLYPDNPYHLDYLHFLECTHEGFYILHEKNADNHLIPMIGYEYEHHEEKPHFHVVVRFRNPRTLNGFMKSIPNCKYYKALPLENIDEATKERFFTVYDVSYTNVPVEEIYKPVITHAEIVSDIYGYAQYVIHKDFKSIVQGKKPYSVADVKPLYNSYFSFSDYFEQTDQSDNELLDMVIQVAACASGDMNTFIQLVQMHSNTKLLKYVQSHSYFIDKFVLSPNRMIVEKESQYE